VDVPKIEAGKVVEIEYTLRLEDDEIADSTDGHPLPYLHGGDEVIDGLQAALEGHEAGDRFVATVQPDQGFGPYDEDLIEEVARSDIPDDVELEVGREIIAETEEGEEIPVYIGAIEDDTVFLDFNHPLAGEVLRYEVTVVSVRDATAEEKERGYLELPDEAGHDHHSHED
jgi:FKBP-type peptidyl-prolyl cis-trans isomerase SlyD